MGSRSRRAQGTRSRGNRSIEHAYTIASGRIAIESPVTPEDSRILDSHRIETPPSVVAGDGVVNADLSDIRPNGWFTVSLRFPAHAVVTAQPQWRQHDEHLAALAPRWALAAGIVLVLSLVLVVAVRRSSPAPLPPPVESTVSSAPAPLAPAFAASLAANGRTPPASAMATLMDLATHIEVLEDVRRRASVDPEKKFLQALIQTAVALHHHSTGNVVGCKSLMARALRNFSGYPEGFCGVELEHLRAALGEWQQALAEGGELPPCRDYATESITLTTQPLVGIACETFVPCVVYGLAAVGVRYLVL